MEDIENFQVKEVFLQFMCFVYETNQFAFLLGLDEVKPHLPNIENQMDWWWCTIIYFGSGKILDSIKSTLW